MVLDSRRGSKHKCDIVHFEHGHVLRIFDSVHNHRVQYIKEAVQRRASEKERRNLMKLEDLLDILQQEVDKYIDEDKGY